MSDGQASPLAAGPNREQLAELFRQHRDHLRRMVAFRLDRRLARRIDASDVIQEALLNAYERREHLADPDGPAALGWLRLVTEQTLVDLHRRHLGAACRDAGREQALPAGGGETTMVAMAAVLADGASSASQAAMRNERLAALEAALGQMDPLDREVLALRHFEELSNQEVADLLGLQKSAASNRYIRALGRLREILVGLPELAGESTFPGRLS